jgi:hypothetical protein
MALATDSLIIRITRLRVAFTCAAHPPQRPSTCLLFLLSMCFSFIFFGSGLGHLDFFRCCVVGLIPG